ncbi:hypothetical protein F4679DRAFT_582256 [Xylaria curta]|nr:hypothetical protein F4679DRAFT_582256 [Xylaria curta]
MLYYQHPHVKTLKAIADNWWREPKLNSLSTSSLAVQDPYSEGVSRFVKWYRETEKIDLQMMTTSQLERELWQFMVDIDELFFFSLLTRKVEKQSGLDGLLRLRLTDQASDTCCGVFKQEPTSPYIRMYRKDHKGETWHFEEILGTLVHEMCHAFLDIFSDRRDPRFQEFVTDYEGHGEMFWVLLRFVARKLLSYTRSERWLTELTAMESECIEMTQTTGEAGSWGTPEKVLMGGVWTP